jgi:hypothetical protein
MDRNQRLVLPLAVVMNRFGDQVFTGSTLPLDEDGLIRLGHLSDKLKNLLHLRMIPDDIREGIFFTHLLPKMVELPLHLLGLKRLPDDRKKLFQIIEDRFFKKVEGALLQCVNGH